MRLKVLLIISFSFLIAACGILIEKRIHNKGYHIAWNSKKISDRSKNDAEKSSSFSEVDESRSVNDAIEPKQGTSSLILESIDEEGNQLEGKRNEVLDNVSIQNESLISENKQSKREKVSRQKAIQMNNHIAKSKRSSWFDDDILLYSLASGLFLTSFAGIRIWKNRSMKFSRWASRNSRIARGFIVLSHLILAILGFEVGRHCNQLGVNFTEFSSYSMSGAFLLGALFLHKIEKAGKGFVNWKSYFQHRTGHLVIGISFFTLMIGSGNQYYSGRHQTSVAGKVISLLSPTGEELKPNGTQLNEKEKHLEKGKASGGAIALAIILAIVVLALTAMASCSLSCSGYGGGAIAVAFFGVAIATLIVVGIINSSRRKSLRSN